jgi:DNA-binding SARP family transcriptional activator
MLADSLDGQHALIVFDDCETIAGHDEASTVLGVFLEYLPIKAQAMLLSRDELERPVARMLLEGRIGRVTDEDLALDEHEARALLNANGQGDRDPTQMLAETRGWVAACAFDVHPRSGGRRAAMNSYLRTEILGRLPEDEQRFLLYTSVLNAVTPRMAVGLCGAEAYSLWRRVRTRYLPATITADRTLVYHQGFRTFLREQLELRYHEELPGLYRRHAEQLVDQGMFEEAVSIYLQLGELDEATLVAERAVPQLIERADWQRILTWFEALGPDRVGAHPVLEGAHIRCLYFTRRTAELRELIDTLVKTGELDKVAKADPGVVAYLGWALHWQPAEALQLIDTYAGDFRKEGVRFTLQAISGRDPVAAPAETNWEDVERLVSWGLLVQGRLPDLLDMLPNEQEWSPLGFYRTPHPLLGLVWQGEIGRARELLDQVPSAVREGAHTDLWYLHEAWLRWAEHDLPGALESARSAVAHCLRTGFGWEPCFNTAVGYFLTLLGRPDDARSVLSEALTRSTTSRNRAYAEWALTFDGLRCLQSGEPADAVRRLRRAHGGMRRARRQLFLPFAGLYLAEAEWQLGNEERSLELANDTLDEAEAMGATFIVQRVLEHLPQLLERMIEHDPTGQRWHRVQAVRRPTSGISRAVEAPVVGEHCRSLEIQPFGDRADLILDGRPVAVRRLKMIEMATYLAMHPGGVDRKRLQARLFPDTDQRHGGNYFRQIVHKLRLSTGIALERNGSGLVTWPAELFVDSADQRFERLVRDTTKLSRADRYARLQEALDIPDGDFLQESDLDWAEERRFELGLLRVEALSEAAELAFALGRLEETSELAERAVRADPYAETAYRTLMSVEAAIGPPGAVMTVFRRLTEALSALGLEPSAESVALLNRLRNAS